MDERYIDSVTGTTFRRGEIRALNAADLWSCGFALTDTVIRTDAAVAEKFGLQRTSFAPSMAAAGVLEPAHRDDDLSQSELSELHICAELQSACGAIRALTQR